MSRLKREDITRLVILKDMQESILNEDSRNSELSSKNFRDLNKIHSFIHGWWASLDYTT